VEYDIVVVGAGPAGLSAAVRAAWVAAPAATYRARILVLDAGDAPGGLSRWQPLVINSPGIIFTKRELKALLNACAGFGVEIKQEQVLCLRAVDGGFEAETRHGSYRTLATILAVGCRIGHPGEHRLFHRNRILWFFGNDMLDRLMAELDANETIETVCLCGAEAVAATRRHLDRPRRIALRAFAEPPYAGPPAAGVERGRLDAVAVDPAQRRLALSFVTEDGRREAFETDILLVDFNAYQKTATSLAFLQATLPRQGNGYLDPKRDMSFDVPGLFSAGDVNGAPFGVAKAVSEGTLAGFAAYGYVCAARTGAAPNLFPFYPYEM
jgi:thioredoxin reductase